jgi:hypothetical protein
VVSLPEPALAGCGDIDEPARDHQGEDHGKQRAEPRRPGLRAHCGGKLAKGYGPFCPRCSTHSEDQHMIGSAYYLASILGKVIKGTSHHWS